MQIQDQTHGLQMEFSFQDHEVLSQNYGLVDNIKYHVLTLELDCHQDLSQKSIKDAANIFCGSILRHYSASWTSRETSLNLCTRQSA